MQISRQHLYKIIVEEYAAEEGIILSEDKVDDLLAWVKGGEKPDWVDDDREIPDPPELPPTPEPAPSADDTMPLGPSDIPSDDAPERDVSGFQDRAGPPLEDQLMDLIQGLPPEEVADLFQAVFEKIPGVEMGPAEEEPETLYTPGAEGRPQVGFKMEELMKLIREVISEGHYHDMGGEDEMYNALDPHGFDEMTDAQIVDAAWRDGFEEIVVLDGEGDLANREEVVVALKNV